MDQGWYCPRCGRLDRAQLKLYQEGLFNAHSKRLDPRCTACGSPAAFHSAGDGVAESAARWPQVLIISGTCASGKSTLSYLLSEQYGLAQVDGDWVLEQRKTRENRPVSGDAIHQELLTLAEGLVYLGHAVALAHIIVPEFLPLYAQYLGDRQIDHRIVILMPERTILMTRNQERKCWPKTTPEYWVNKFYQAFLDAPHDVSSHFYDNSSETAEQSAANLFRMLRQAPTT